MSAGAHVIGSRTTPVEEVITHGQNGTLVDFFDVQGWSATLTEALAHHVAAVADASKPAGKCLRLEFSVAPQEAGGPLTSTGLLIVNPPWTLAGELKIILPELEKPLGQGGASRFRLETPKP